MKAIQITAPGQIQPTEIAKPVMKSGEVLLRVVAAGFCGSDLNTFLGRNPMVRLPVIPGHEIGAVIEAVAPDVPAGFVPGTTVTVDPYTACGKCPSCRNGRVNACQHNETFGVQRNGAMTAYIAVPWSKVIPAPGISPVNCALIEPMSVGFHAIARAEVTDTDQVLVIGCGMIGLGAIVRASLRGATVTALDIDTDKLALARRLGAAHTIHSQTEEVHERLLQITGGTGPDVVVEAVGSPATYVMAIDEVAFTGRVVCIGYAKSEVTFQTKYFVQKELDIRGSRNALPADFRAVIRYLSQGTCPTEQLISRIVSPEEVPDAMQEWAANPGKVFRIIVSF